MKKKILLLIIVSIFVLTGCGNKEKADKKENSQVKENDVIKEEKVNDEIKNETQEELTKQEKNNYVSYNGNLKLEGVNLVNQYNEKIQLKGVSSHGLQWFNE